MVVRKLLEVLNLDALQSLMLSLLLQLRSLTDFVLRKLCVTHNISQPKDSGKKPACSSLLFGSKEECNIRSTATQLLLMRRPQIACRSRVHARA